jgi:TPR repeat protein
MLRAVAQTAEQMKAIDAEAFKKLQEEAQKGDAKSLWELGQAYYFGNGDIKKDRAKALECFEKAAALGNAGGMAGRAQFLTKGWLVEQNFPEALKLLKEAALKGDQSATFNYAEHVRFGLGCEPDLEEAAVWYAKSADSVIAEGKKHSRVGQLSYAAGLLYQNGWGVDQNASLAEKNFDKAVILLQSEIAAGDTDAMMFLADMMANGYGLPKDVKAARSMLNKAVDLGDGEAKWMLEHAPQYQLAEKPAAAEPPPAAAQPPAESAKPAQ